MWPPSQKPVVAIINLTETSAPMEARSAAIAEIGATLAAVMASSRQSASN